MVPDLLGPGGRRFLGFNHEGEPEQTLGDCFNDGDRGANVGRRTGVEEVVQVFPLIRSEDLLDLGKKISVNAGAGSRTNLMRSSVRES